VQPNDGFWKSKIYSLVRTQNLYSVLNVVFNSNDYFFTLGREFTNLPYISLLLSSHTHTHVYMLYIYIYIIRGNLRERDHCGHPDVDGRIILRWIFGEW